MNCDILEKEFYQLDRAIKESTNEISIPRPPVDLAEFLRNSPLEEYPLGGGGKNLSTPLRSGSEQPRRGESSHKGHLNLGVQKGSALLKSITDITKTTPVLKGQRREDILNIIKINGGNATIKDIKDKIAQLSSATTDGDKGHSLAGIGEKTLQRELLAMVADGVLKKEGDKRWSRYILGSRE